jgi:hypothetical protein
MKTNVDLPQLFPQTIPAIPQDMLRMSCEKRCPETEELGEADHASKNVKVEELKDAS